MAAFVLCPSLHVQVWHKARLSHDGALVLDLARIPLHLVLELLQPVLLLHSPPVVLLGLLDDVHQGRLLTAPDAVERDPAVVRVQAVHLRVHADVADPRLARPRHLLLVIFLVLVLLARQHPRQFAWIAC